MSEIYVVRHGQAAFGTDDYDRLTEIGWEQSRLLGEYFRGRETRFASVFTGDMRRHRETLAGLRDSLPGTPDAEVLPGLNEYDFHSMLKVYPPALERADELKDAKQFYRLLREALKDWSEGGLQGAGESWQDFEGRVDGTLQRIAEVDGPVLVITSGGASSAMLRNILGLTVDTMIDLNLQARNTGVSQYYCKRGAYLLNSFNTVPHLEQPQDRHLITYT